MYIYGKMERRSRYKKVSVLLLRWKEDAARESEVSEIEKVLDGRYGYHIEKWTIPTCPNPTLKLSVQMGSFIDQAGSDHLLIIYYAGHSYVGPDNQVYWARCVNVAFSGRAAPAFVSNTLIFNLFIFSSSPRPDACRLKWGSVRCLFDDAQSDILLLLDTCAVDDSPNAGSHGTKQAIAAYSPGQQASEHQKRSFTSYLAESLYNLSSGRPWTVQRLYDEIMLVRGNDIAAMPVNGGGLRPPPPERNPTFFTLTSGKDEQLTLAPLYPQGPQAQETTSPSTNGHGFPDLTFEEARVLVCTTFVGDASPEMAFYNQWLQHRPAIADKITMESMFLGPPTMLLVSMPVSAWNVVQHDKVCCFLGYINSHNLSNLYNDLVKSSAVPRAASGPSGHPVLPVQHQRLVDGGRMLREAGPVTANSPTTKRRHEVIAQQASTYSEHSARPDAPARNPLPNSAPPANAAITPTSMRSHVEDSAEMNAAAEQLKALSHVRHASDGGTSSGGFSERRYADSRSSMDPNESAMELQPAPPARKPLAKAQPKFDTRCTQCPNIAPFKDSSSLRKHIAAAHTRPFPCAFRFAGCTSTFGSKNEWKRHISSQHLCLQYYRCSACPSSVSEGKGNEFNRKDLFTQHLRRMHAPFQIKKNLAKDDTRLHSDWEYRVKDMQTSCLVTRRTPPQHVACPKQDCLKEFEGNIAWDEWTEHVGRHMEKGDAPSMKDDDLLIKWAVDEGIIEEIAHNKYRFVPSDDANGVNMRRDSLANGSFTSDGPHVSDHIKSEDDKAEDDKAEAEKTEEDKAEDERAQNERAQDQRAQDERAEDERAEDDKAEDDKVEDDKAEDESTTADSVSEESDKIRHDVESNDPDSIVVATSTAMHNRRDTDN